MTHIGDYAGDVERWGGPVEPAAAEPSDDTLKVKGLMVLRLLQDAALTPPFGFNPEDAAGLWGQGLRAFSTDTLMAAVGDWVAHPSAEWPSIGDMVSCAQGIEALSRSEASRGRLPCRTCEDRHWVKAVDLVETVETFGSKQARLKDPNAEPEYSEIEHYHLAPCPACPEMRERRILYDAWAGGGHFSPKHQNKGGCFACWPYMASHARRAKHMAERAR